MFKKILRRIPLPLLAIVVGLATGLGVWAVLEQIQSRQVKKIFESELESRLDLRSRESLIRFDQYVGSYAATARLLANHRDLAAYLEPLLWSDEDAFEPLSYEGFRPQWLPDFFDRNALATPSHVVLTDAAGRVREVYQAHAQPLPPSLLDGVPSDWLDAREVRRVLARLGDRDYLIVTDAVEDARGYAMGYLALLVPIDHTFLAASQRGPYAGYTVVALVDAAHRQIVVSSHPKVLPPGSAVADWRARYRITSQPLPYYRGSEWHPLLATFVAQASVEKMSRHVRHFERRQRGLAAVAFITVFTLVIYLVSSRIDRVLRRLSGFSRRELGISEPGFERGANQLLLLEEWMRHFTALVVEARDKLNRQHASELRETEALKAAVMEASLDSVVTLDDQGTIIELNPTAAKAFGLGRDEATGCNFERFVPANERERFAQMLTNCVRDRAARCPPRSEMSAVRPDGSTFPAEVSMVPIDLESRRFYILYMHDISARKAAERQIQSLARLASESPDPILRVDSDGVIVYANAASHGLLDNLATAVGQVVPPTWAGEIDAVLMSGDKREIEAECGEQRVALLFAPIGELGYVNLYGRDVTAVRRAEQQSRRHQAELVHVCRLSTMGEVATGMAHELNQPLSAIANFANGCTRRLKGGTADPTALIDAMDNIAGQARRASEIIRRLRALVGKQPPVYSTVDLNALVQEVCSFLEFECTTLNLAIDLDLAADGILVDVDLVQIEQVLLNLIKNALDALEGVPQPERSLIVRTRRRDDQAEASIEDNGPGITPEIMGELFEPFVTTKEQGMGMGLAISQTIVVRHGGRIWAEPNSGGGAVFRLRLPVAARRSNESVVLLDRLTS